MASSRTVPKAVLRWIRVYAVGIGAVFEETQLADMVRSSGGAYYSAPNLESLFRDQLGRLIDDLLGQYMASYISLRPEGSHSVRVQVSVQGTTAAFHTQPVEFSSFYGPDTQGILAFDPPAISEVLGQATVYARALHVPRNIARFRFRHTSEGPMDVKLVPRDGGGLLEGWQLSGPDGLGYYDVSSTSPLAFWDFGVLFKLVMPWVTGDASEIPVEFDNSIYTAGKSFIYPPYPDDVDILGYRESVQVVVSEADIEVEGDLEFLSSLYWWAFFIASIALFGAYLRVAVGGEGRLTLPLESLNGLGTISLLILAVLVEGWQGGLAIVAGILLIGPPIAYAITLVVRSAKLLERPLKDVPREAIAEYNEAIRREPRRAVHYYDRGRLCLNLGHHQRAINDYDRVIRLDPRHGAAYYLRGQVYSQLGQEQRAIEDFDEAIQLNPRLADAYFARARAYTLLGRDAEAAQDVDQAVNWGIAPIFLEEAIERLRVQRSARRR